MGATLITSQEVSINDLKEIELPDKTNTYQPVSHVDFIDNTRELADRFLSNHVFHSEQYGIAREGKQMFGTMTYKRKEDDGLTLDEMLDDVGLSIGIRNSYDKSMSLGICCGASVFVCENLMMNGAVTIMRRHEGRILDELNGLIFNALIDSEHKFKVLHAHSKVLQDIPINDKTAYGIMGRLYGFGVISERQIPVMKNEWKNPSHSIFEDRTAWSLYNAGTESLKKTPPLNRMNKQVKLHTIFEKEFALDE